tara:strand:- start:135 stop:515 length:381 start_codon:yes stop_codon:yes gene_type:complete
MRRTKMSQEDYKELEKEYEVSPEDFSFIINEVNTLSIEDTEQLHISEQSYGDSWRKRGGVGAFMMLARKWDRLENQTIAHNWDIFKAIESDERPEGILDDIKDLRRYLFLVEAHMRTKDSDEQSKS